MAYEFRTRKFQRRPVEREDFPFWFSGLADEPRDVSAASLVPLVPPSQVAGSGGLLSGGLSWLTDLTKSWIGIKAGTELQKQRLQTQAELQRLQLQNQASVWGSPMAAGALDAMLLQRQYEAQYRGLEADRSGNIMAGMPMSSGTMLALAAGAVALILLMRR